MPHITGRERFYAVVNGYRVTISLAHIIDLIKA